MLVRNKAMLNHVFKKSFIWIGDYFPSIPRFFGLKILTYGYVDSTPDLGIGNTPKEKSVESKISYLIKKG